MDLCDEVYAMTDGFPKREIFGLTAQLRDSASSVPSNIAEGEGRMTRGEKKQFLGHARGSLYEVETRSIIAKRRGYPVTGSVFKMIESTKSALDGYIRYVLKR
jgi:four helix bundle protein